MAIGTNDTIQKFGTQDEVTSISPAPSTVATGAFSGASDTVAWTNDDDAPYASFLLKCQYDTTAPTDGQGSIDLYGRLLNVQSTNDLNTPDADFLMVHLGTFLIDWGVANDVDFYTPIPHAVLPNMKSSQEYEFYIQNNNGGQTIGASWQLWVTPFTYGPAA